MFEILILWGVSFIISCEYNIETLRVIRCSPVNGATGVSGDCNIDLEFNNPVSRGDAEINFRLSGSNGYISGWFEWASGRCFRFHPAVSLPCPGRYVIEMSRDTRDENGNIMDSDFVSEFYSGSDYITPAIMSSDPARGAGAVTGISIDHKITIVFSKSMNRESVERGFFLSPDVPGYFVWSESSPGIPDSSVTYTLLSAMNYSKLYTFTIYKSASDISGNQLAADYTVNFITGSDFTPPRVSGMYDSAVIPGYWAAGSLNSLVKKSVRIAVDFSKAMNRVSAENSFFITPSVAGSFEWVSDYKMIFIPDGPLDPEGIYQTGIEAGAEDMNGLRIDRRYAVDLKIDSADSLKIRCGNIYGSNDGSTYMLISSGVPDPYSWPLLINMGSSTNQVYFVRIEFVSGLLPYTPAIMNRYSVMDSAVIETFKSTPGTVDNAMISDITWLNGSTVILKFTPLTNTGLGHNPYLYRLTVAGGRSGAYDVNGNFMDDDLVIEFREGL